MLALRHVGVIVFVVIATAVRTEAVWFVDASNTNDLLENGSFFHPFGHIQEGVDAATNGEIVIVADGVYKGAGNKNLDFAGTDIVLVSFNGPSNAIIDCENEARGFHFQNAETSNSIVQGFTIRNGGTNGGAFYCDGASPQVINCILEGHSCEGSGAAAYFEDGDGSRFVDCIFRSNQATSASGNSGRGAAIYMNNATVTLEGCLIGNNQGDGPGSAIYCESGANLTLTNSKVVGNTGDSETISLYGVGEAVLVDSDVSGNTGQGAVFAMAGNVTLVGCNIISNEGYGFSHYYAGGHLLSNCVIRGNTGTGVANGLAWGTILNCSIQGNGSGTYFIGTIRDSEITENGGVGIQSHAVYRAPGSLYVKNCVVAQNAGVGIDGAVPANVTVEDCVVVSNMGFGVTSSGGGNVVNSGYGPTRFSRCRISYNQGGVFAGGGHFDSCEIVYNAGTNTGGGIHANGWQPGTTFTNCLIAFNSGPQAGAIFLEVYGWVSLINCTVRGNQSAEAGLAYFDYQAGISFKNCITWSNEIQPFKVKSPSGGYNTIEAAFSDIQFGSTNDWFNVGEGNLDLDPLFASSSDSHLSVMSPCIAVGTSDGAPTNDIEGVSRGDPPDMGAYEYPKTDIDFDGLPDWWEVKYFGDTSQGPSSDYDGDHMSNALELQQRTDPTDNDSDGDSLVDGWEFTYGLDPLSRVAYPATYLIEKRISLDVGTPFTDVKARSNIVVAVGGSSLYTIDVSSPSSPSILGSCAVNGAARVYLKDEHAYVAGDLDWSIGSLLAIVRITDPAQPVVVYSTNATITTADLDLVGGRCYLSSSFDIYPSSRLRVLDITEPTNVYKVGSIFLDNNGHRFGTLKNVGDFVYIESSGNLLAMDVQEPTNIVIAGSAPTDEGGGLGGMRLQSNALYYAKNGNLFLVDISNGTGPVVKTSFDLAHTAENLDLAGQLAVVPEGFEGLEILDTSGGTNITSFGVINTDGLAHSADIEGNTLFVADGHGGLGIYDMLGVDLDHDGMSDEWEVLHFGSTSHNALSDYDGDGLWNLGEFRAGLDPTQEDSDNDGILDGDEVVIYNSDPRLADTDGDGASDSHELAAGTGLLNADSFFGVSVLYAGGSHAVVTWQTVYGNGYWIQKKSSLIAGAWENVWPFPVFELDESPEGTETVIDLNGSTNSKVYYRILLD